MKNSFALALAICFFGMGCGHGKTVCAVVDAANHACTVIRYMDRDGSIAEVRVEREDLASFARQAATKQAAAKQLESEAAVGDE